MKDKPKPQVTTVALMDEEGNLFKPSPFDQHRVFECGIVEYGGLVHFHRTDRDVRRKSGLKTTAFLTDAVGFSSPELTDHGELLDPRPFIVGDK